MIINLRKLIIRVGILLLFIFLTSFFYIVISKLLGLIGPHFQYKKPTGEVVEVNMPLKSSPMMNFRELLYYYWGEGE